MTSLRVLSEAHRRRHGIGIWIGGKLQAPGKYDRQNAHVLYADTNVMLNTNVLEHCKTSSINFQNIWNPKKK